MHLKTAATLLGALLAPGTMLAQSPPCFDPNIGTDLLLADDATAQGLPLGFTFTFAGVNYTDVCVCSNGYIWMGPTSVAGGDFTPTEAELLSGAPRICPLWIDFNPGAAGSGHVYFQTVPALGTNPAHALITWSGVYGFGTTTPRSVQVRMDANSHVRVTYGLDLVGIAGGSFGNGTSIIGASPGGGAASNLVSFATRPFNTNLNTFAEVIAVPTPGFQYSGVVMEWIPSAATTGYVVIDIPCPIATATRYGTGCYDASRTFYEHFVAASAFDLTGISMTLISTGSNYVAVPNLASYVAPSAAATSLVLGDDAEVGVTLTNAFPGLSGPTGALTVCSNGFVSPGSGNGTAFTPSVAAWHNSALERWGDWHDFNPAATGGGQVKFEEIGPIAYVTWDGVYDFGQTTPNTWQLQFDTASGNVTFAWQSISGLGNAHVVGYSAMGPSRDLGSRDISATLPGTFATGTADTFPLDLAASARPIIGTSFNLVTSNTANAQLGANILSLVQIFPGVDLTAIGMPGCFQYVSPAVVTVFIPVGGMGSSSVTVPNNPGLAGLDVYSQSGAFASGFNVLGVIASNGVKLHLDVN